MPAGRRTSTATTIVPTSAPAAAGNMTRSHRKGVAYRDPGGASAIRAEPARCADQRQQFRGQLRRARLRDRRPGGPGGAGRPGGAGWPPVGAGRSRWCGPPWWRGGAGGPRRRRRCRWRRPARWRRRCRWRRARPAGRPPVAAARRWRQWPLGSQSWPAGESRVPRGHTQQQRASHARSGGGGRRWPSRRGGGAVAPGAVAVEDGDEQPDPSRLLALILCRRAVGGGVAQPQAPAPQLRGFPTAGGGSRCAHRSDPQQRRQGAERDTGLDLARVRARQ